MEVARINARGQTTIPKRVREQADLHAGDLISFEVEASHLVVRKVAAPPEDSYLRAVARTMSEWDSPEDEEAWRDL